MTHSTPDTLGEIPEWAIERVGEVCGYEPRSQAPSSWWWEWEMTKSFARYIAQHEEPPVDPLLIEAREINAKREEAKGNDWSPAGWRAGNHDKSANMEIALAALKRGIELGAAK